jgi:hypothetical protein
MTNISVERLSTISCSQMSLLEGPEHWYECHFEPRQQSTSTFCDSEPEQDEGMPSQEKKVSTLRTASCWRHLVAFRMLQLTIPKKIVFYHSFSKMPMFHNFRILIILRST